MFYLADFSSLCGRMHLPRRTSEAFVPDDLWRTENWVERGVDVLCEVGEGREGRLSVQAYVEDVLLDSNSPIVVLDHGTGEIADLVAISVDGLRVDATLYHCKKAGGEEAGLRVGDVYEVAGRVVRSVRWLGRPSLLAAELVRRIDTIATSRALRGERELRQLTEGSRGSPLLDSCPGSAWHFSRSSPGERWGRAGRSSRLRLGGCRPTTFLVLRVRCLE